MLTVGELEPGYVIGGLPRNLGQGALFNDSKHFVIEGDEYDSAFFDKRSKFIHYLPELLVLNNIEFDHADIFDDLDAVKLSFRRLRQHRAAKWDDPAQRRRRELRRGRARLPRADRGSRFLEKLRASESAMSSYSSQGSHFTLGEDRVSTSPDRRIQRAQRRDGGGRSALLRPHRRRSSKLP